MRILWFCLLLKTVFAYSGFGSSHWKNSKLCHQWTCLNEKLVLPDTIPPRDQYDTVLRSLLPEGAWHDVVPQVLDTCYGETPRRYTTTCPGQGMLHCAVEYLIDNCPEASLRKDDACAPVTSLAGFKYMFSQSRYDNLERYMPTERRPSWFLKTYFNSKCCDLPELFNSTVLSECGFDTVLRYHIHQPSPDYNIAAFNNLENPISTTQKYERQIVEFSDAPQDPLECCHMAEFIQPSWRSECGFHLTWSDQTRLEIKEDVISTTPIPVTSTEKPTKSNVKIVPHSCDKEICVFRKLNIISDDGSVDSDAFSKLLDNLTSVHSEWRKAKARVVTKCLTKPIMDYEAKCEINKILACTFDVLSENCPYAKKADPCKHATVLKNDTVCQISSSKYRPKNRRQYCGLPSLVHHEVLAECGVSAVSRLEYQPDTTTVARPAKSSWTSRLYACKDTTTSTTCLMKKMGVLNKYGFMDYFKMKDKIRHFTGNEAEWSAMMDVYINAFTGMPMYRDHCSSSKKLLNVVDAMLMTCPVSKRRESPQCDKIFAGLAHLSVNGHHNVTKEKLSQILNHFHHVFLPHSPLPRTGNVQPKQNIFERKPLFDFGILKSDNVPPVRVINIKPSRMNLKKPLVLLPVYRRMSSNFKTNLNVPLRTHRDKFPTRAPMLLHKEIGTPIFTDEGVAKETILP